MSHSAIYASSYWGDRSRAGEVDMDMTMMLCRGFRAAGRLILSCACGVVWWWWSVYEAGGGGKLTCLTASTEQANKGIVAFKVEAFKLRDSGVHLLIGDGLFFQRLTRSAEARRALAICNG